MTDLMQCVPISTGALSPDQRVNYQFGLVLGVDEFTQEDLYFRERDERSTRTLHGYGTASGLHVVAERPAAAPLDVEVRVDPGIAFDQYGRPVVVRSAQCARLGAWIAGQEDAADAAGEPSPLEAHRRPSGDTTIYVVAEYSSCLDALVPLPGKPCGSDDDVMAPSRVRDSWNLGFRWGPPEMPRWWGLGALADLFVGVELRDGSPVESDEAILAAHIRALAPGASAPSVPLPPAPVLPRAEARLALDRLLTIWVTEVRPLLEPDLIAPEGEAAVLLSSVTLTTAAPFDRAAPEVVSFAAADDTGRPYLAPTQLLQELIAMGGGVTTILAGSPPAVPAPPPPVEVATLGETTVAGVRQLVVWSALPNNLVLPGTVAVRRNGAAAVNLATAPGTFPGSTFVRAPADRPFADGDHVDVQLDLRTVSVLEGGGTVALPAWLRAAGVTALGAQGDRLILHHDLATLPTAPPPPPVLPTRQLVTATAGLLDNEIAVVELWWHVDEDFRSDVQRVGDLDRDAFQVLAEVEIAATPVDVPFEIEQVQHNVFRLRLDMGIWTDRATRSPYLRVLAGLERVVVDTAGVNAIEWGERLGVRWADTEREGTLLALPVRMNRTRLG